ncbi:MAG: hypothetical protein RRZ68_05670 [Oscillospiraceae bacterium]
MQALFKELHSNFKNINNFSRLLMKYGGILVISLYAAAFTCFLVAGSISDYSHFMRLCFEFLECGKECMGAVFVPAFLIQIVVTAEKIK